VKILAVGAHPDDVELGCGGTLALFKKREHEVYVLVLTRGEASGDPEVREHECKVAAEIIGVDRLFLGGLRDTRITDGIDTITAIENIINTVAPDIVFTHSSKDAHQDHRNTHLASLSAARDIGKIFLYESPAALREFLPQVYVDVAETIETKLKAVAMFESQALKSYIKDYAKALDPSQKWNISGSLSNASEGLARFRGFQVGLALAESFEVARYLLEIEPR
jgi:LmbE family N-acetylglucosaminyl deacetylase